jgi:hypothetical protein
MICRINPHDLNAKRIITAGELALFSGIWNCSYEIQRLFFKFFRYARWRSDDYVSRLLIRRGISEQKQQ